MLRRGNGGSVLTRAGRRGNVFARTDVATSMVVAPSSYLPPYRRDVPERPHDSGAWSILAAPPSWLGASELGGGQLRRRTEPGAPRRSPAGLVASMARRCAPVRLGRPLVRDTPGQGILPRDHGHLFYRKPVGVFVSLI